MAGRIVNFPANGKKTEGYFAIPDSGKGPGVIVIQEWWGLVGHIKAVADRFAEQGYVALAPDLYHGKATKSPDEAGKLMMALNIAEAERDLRGAVDYLAEQESTQGDKIGVVGFCMGGQLALYAASKNPRIGACVDFYGVHPNVKPELEKIRGAVLGLFAENDSFVTPEVARDLEKKLEKAGVDVEVHIYPGTDHAFFNDERSDVYNEEAAADAWKRVMDFLGRHLATA